MAVRILDPSNVPLKRRKEGSIWATMTQVFVVAIVVVLMAGVLLLFIPVMERTQHLRSDNAELTRKTIAEQERQQQLTQEMEAMKNDPAYLERVARNVLNLGKTNEVIYRFPPLHPDPGLTGQDNK